jgi:hypothetical protein
MEAIPGIMVDGNITIQADIPSNIDAIKLFFEKDNQQDAFEKVFMLKYDEDERYEVIIRKKQ